MKKRKQHEDHAMDRTTILIVEDEAIVAADLAAKLRQLGYEVAGISASGEDAIGQASRLRPHLVLMDIMLEGPMDGIEAAGAISREVDVPVIYLTAHSDAATLTRAKVTQPFGYILKPFEERELATNIEMALYKHESDRKLREQGEALRESEARLRLLGDNLPESAVYQYAHRTDGSVRFLYCSAGMERLNGVSIRDVLSDAGTLHRQILPEYYGRLVEAEARSAREMSDFDMEVPMRLPDGQVRWMRLRSRPRPMPDGSIVWDGVQTDVTDRRMTEEALRQSERQFRAIFESTQETAILLDDQRRCLKANPGAGRATDTPHEALVGLFLDEFVDGTFPLEATWPLFMETGSFSGEVRVRRSDGTYRIVDATGIARIQPGQHLFVGHDITDRKRMEEELRRSRDELELRVRERTAELSEAYEKLLEETEERKRLEEQLRQAHKMEAVGTLAGGIAHDFNNMLAAILGNAELALDDVDTQNPARRNLDQILKATHRARDLVSEILTFSRKSGKEQRPLRLTPLVKETFKLLRASLPATIKMDLRVAGTDDVVVANPSQVQQVIMNLATNAAQAMPEGGQLEIALFDARFDSGHAVPDPDMRPGEYVELVVRDTGGGMDEAIQQRIFEPFFTTKAVGSGTGLGLSVVYGIIKGCQGAITVTSEVTKGSTFKIFLPKAQGGVEAVEGSRATLPRGTERVIFVDDEETLRDLGESILSRLGYKVTTAEDPGRALRLFRDDPKGYDLIITDYTMPGMTGLTLGKEMLRIRPGIPIILCTGYSEGIDEERAKEAGVKEFVMKPLTKQELAEAVRRTLDGEAEGEKV
jgi:PAS domain S-box-containing protein